MIRSMSWWFSPSRRLVAGLVVLALDWERVSRFQSPFPASRSPAPAKIDAGMEGDLLGELAAVVEVDAEFVFPVHQQGFQLRVAVQAVEHFAHLPACRLDSLMSPFSYCRLLASLAGLIELLPALHEPIGMAS